MIPDVHIGIVTHNSLDDIPNCLEALRKQRYPSLRLTVVDNASTDGTVDWLQNNLEPGQLRLNTANRGFAAGHNQIISAIGAAHYLALNPDVTLHPDYIAALMEMLQRRKAGWGVGKLYRIHGTHLYSVGHALLRNGYAFNIGSGEADSGQYDDEHEIFGAPGAAALYTNGLIRGLGTPFFDERLFAYHEDVDVDWRSQRGGWSCWYSPEAVAYHRGGQASPEMQATALANRYLSGLKNACPGQLATAIVPMMFLHSLFRLLVTPRFGLRMTARLARYSAAMLGSRQPLNGDCQRMRRWFAWSHGQHSQQPRTLAQRFRAFWKTHLSLCGIGRE